MAFFGGYCNMKKDMKNTKAYDNDEKEPYSCLTSLVGLIAFSQIIFTLIVRLSEGGRLCSGDFLEDSNKKQ